ncbi:DUF1707 SHOCT-like domain-containing protein [Couchioplanes azureus]|uniref:DUF1707 SHOCT-like domain-containing protein n=1 Tax=Couchioplanes caeruleus TaxID=56438 RepID=UPI0016700C7B|nr:DUF1707 domain-containing protein [Couchioplanes caeruleus]
MRASDEDRQRIMAALERHTGAGRLTLDEFTQRVGVAAGARTLDELAAVVSDLPAEQAEERQRREFLLLLAIALVTLVLLGVFLALR